MSANGGKADNPTAPAFVRYWGNADIAHGFSQRLLIRHDAALPTPEQEFANFQLEIAKKRDPQVWLTFPHACGISLLVFGIHPRLTFQLVAPPLTAGQIC